MRFGICCSIDQAAGVLEARPEFIEEHIQRLLMPEAPDADFAPVPAKVAKLPLPVEAANCFLPAALKCAGPVVDLERLVHYGGTAFRRANATGIKILVFGSGGARALPEGFPRARAEEQFVELLKRLAPEAEKSGVTIVVEPLHKKECNFINSLAEGAEMVERCGHPSVQLLADVFHMLRDGEPAGEILRFGRMLRHTHIAEKEKRTAPGTAGDDFRPYLRALRQVNYLGRMAIECSLPDLAADSRRGLEALRRQYAEAAP